MRTDGRYNLDEGRFEITVSVTPEQVSKNTVDSMMGFVERSVRLNINSLKYCVDNGKPWHLYPGYLKFKKLPPVMCCVCFNSFDRDKLFVDTAGIKWDMCKTCAPLARPVQD